MWSVKGKVAVVTGASGVLGKAIGERLALQHGAVVALVSHSRPIEALPCSGNLTSDKKSTGSRTTLSEVKSAAFQCDIRSREACGSLFQRIASSLGPTALLINCAGATQSKIFLRTSEEDYDQVMDLNLRGALNVIQAAMRYGGLRSPSIEGSGGGSVVLLGSVAGTRGNEGQVLYCAAKAALSGAVQSLAREYGSKQLRFNVVAPGLIQGTPMWAGLNEAQRSAWVRQSTLGRCATVEEVAEAVIAIALSSFISGKTIEPRKRDLTHDSHRIDHSTYFLTRRNQQRRSRLPGRVASTNLIKMSLVQKNTNFFLSFPLQCGQPIPFPLLHGLQMRPDRAAIQGSLLPAYLVEKQHKVREYREGTFAALEHNMDTAVKKTRSFAAHLRHCTDLVEGSVLALGVPTSYDIVSRLEEVRQGLDSIFTLWKSLAVSRREENRLHDELYDASCGSYATMREKNEQLERELRSINVDRDRKDAALDNAIQYVHAVIAERSAWQEQFGYNRQELPTEDTTFGERCTAALSALYQARRVQTDPQSDAVPDQEDKQKIPQDRPYISLSDDAHSLSKRWNRIEDTRHSMVCKSCRLKYIPPDEETELLRDVLAMGTGSNVLMKDVADERERLEVTKAKVRGECADIIETMRLVKKDLFLMKWFLRDTMEKRAPFAISTREVCKMLTEHVESQAMSLAKQWMADREREREHDKMEHSSPKKRSGLRRSAGKRSRRGDQSTTENTMTNVLPDISRTAAATPSESLPADAEAQSKQPLAHSTSGANNVTFNNPGESGSTMPPHTHCPSPTEGPGREGTRQTSGVLCQVQRIALEGLPQMKKKFKEKKKGWRPGFLCTISNIFLLLFIVCTNHGHIHTMATERHTMLSYSYSSCEMRSSTSLSSSSFRLANRVPYDSSPIPEPPSPDSFRRSNAQQALQPPQPAVVQHRLSQNVSSPKPLHHRPDGNGPKVLEKDFRLDPRPFSRRNGIYLFRGTEISTGIVRAIKIYDIRGADEHKLQRILDEAQIGKKIGVHRFVVSTHAYYVSPEKHAIVMDIWEGGTLLDELMHRGRMTESRAGRLLRMLLQGLAHIHSHRVMHRDIKPENIFLAAGTPQGTQPVFNLPSGASDSQSLGSIGNRSGGEEDLLAIGDFSLATINIPSKDYVGSPQYSAPELAMIGLQQDRRNANRPFYNEKCDIWSVGVVAFVMLTGLLPFDGDTPEKIFMEVLKNSIPFDKAQYLSQGAKEFILAMTRSNPSARPTAKDALRHPWIIAMK
eukprot:gene10291-7193_t